MSPVSAIAFIAIGAALMLLASRTRRGGRVEQGLSLLAALAAMLAIIGYIDHADALYRLMLYTQVALHTAIALFLLSVAVFFVRLHNGFAGDLMGDGPGSAMARRFLPAVFVVPITLGWICLRGQGAGLYGGELGVALDCTSTVVIFAFMIWLTAITLDKESDRRNKAEREYRELNAQLEARVEERTESLAWQTVLLAEQAALLDIAPGSIFVRDMQNRVTFWNKGATGKYGWTVDQALERVIAFHTHTRPSVCHFHKESALAQYPSTTFSFLGGKSNAPN